MDQQQFQSPQALKSGKKAKLRSQSKASSSGVTAASTQYRRNANYTATEPRKKQVKIQQEENPYHGAISNQMYASSQSGIRRKSNPRPTSAKLTASVNQSAKKPRGVYPKRVKSAHKRVFEQRDIQKLLDGNYEKLRFNNFVDPSGKGAGTKSVASTNMPSAMRDMQLANHLDKATREVGVYK